MQLVIPMSGIGQRFIKAGYKTPKPLLEIENKPIIEHIYNMFDDMESIVFICNKEHLENPSLQMESKIYKINPNAKIVSIEPHKKGPIFAVLKSIDYLDLNSPTIINYCDFNCIWNFKKFKEHIKRTNCDGCVVTYTGFHPHMLANVNYAYLKMNQLQIEDIQEKKPFTSNPMDEHASSGTYYFKSAHTMKKYFCKTIEEDLSVNNEYYVSLSFKPMIKDNLKLNNFNIKYFMQWGTPVDFEEYKWFSKMFKAKINNRQKGLINQGTLLIPCAGLGKRFQEANIHTPKPLINISNKPMLLQVINDLPNFNKVKIIFRNDINKNKLIKKNIENNFKNADIKFIDYQTDGQASTCLLGLEEKDLKDPLLISACDNGVIYDNSKFNNLKNDLTNDIIIWGCRNYPGARKNPHMYGWIKEEKSLIKRVFVKKQYKDPQKDPIIIGTFYFKNAGIFKKIAENMIENNQRVNNEFYVDSCINNAIEMGLKVVMFEVDYYLCWGTPEDLKTYKYWQNCFDEWDQHPYKKVFDDDFVD